MVLLSIVFLGLVFIQCKSKEDKALGLIEERLFKTLYDFDSYQPIETKIDSAFHTPLNDSINLRYAIFCSVILDEFDKYIEKANDASKTAEIWTDSYTSYGRGKFLDALDDMTTSIEIAEKLLQQSKLYRDSIRLRSEEIIPEFIGWRVEHKFRCKTKGGYSDILSSVYIMDEKITRIIDEINLEDKDYKRWQDIIKDALESKEE